ncbi:50S ribosomal protein L4, partial [Bacillus pumilus]|uniref:50S ribosomal protein L4 n=1 Tax=Bacillus pumilus TaxID=1408 RepID=UPI00119D3F40
KGEIELNGCVFGIEGKERVVLDGIVMERGWLGEGSEKVKSGCEVGGGGGKGWREKGSGGGGEGCMGSGEWGGGGMVFGPTGGSYSYKLPKKVGRLAIKS